MLKFKTLKAKNFMSFGNVEQVLDLCGTNIALIFGLNKDAVCSGEEGMGDGNRNGVGKSAIIQSLCYALYGKSIDNKIKVGNLINNVNRKNCEVTLEFEKNGSIFRIERGRSPTYLRVFENGKEKDATEVDEAQGDSGDTQKYLERIIGMSQNMFQSIVVFSALTSNFLADKAGDQRSFIEELLGLDQLSYKADILKEKIKTNKALLMAEDARITSAIEYNNKTSTIIYELNNKSTAFESNKQLALATMKAYIDGISLQEIEREIEKFEQNDVLKNTINEYNSAKNDLQQCINRHEQWLASEKNKKQLILDQLNALSSVDIDLEERNHAEIDSIRNIEQQNAVIVAKITGVQSQLQSNNKAVENAKRRVDQLNAKLTTEYHNDKCPTCGSQVDESKHNAVLLNIANDVVVATAEFDQLVLENNELLNQLQLLQVLPVPHKPTVVYKTISEARAHGDTVNRLTNEYQKPIDESPFAQQIIELESKVGSFDQEYINTTEYKSEKYASKSAAEYEIMQYHQAVNNYDRTINSINPYVDQVQTLQDSIVTVSYDEMNRLKTLIEHQEFLVKTLTHKDSFIRKKLIEQNTGYLNKRLESHLAAAGSQFNITFSPDLSIRIESVGLEYDYEQLSRGERNRCIIPLNLAFRDVFEALYGHINLLFVDELLDNGLDPVGIHNAWDMLSDISIAENKNVFVISHREELTTKGANVLRIVKENRFSTIEQLDEDS